jgi:acylglycerol lipase
MFMAQTLTHTYREEKVPTAGGLQVFIRSWRPAAPARALVTIVPGFNSHSGHYLWVGEQLAASGFAVYAVDLRGRGQSDGERFYIEHFSEYLSDVRTLMTLAASREPGLPVYLLGHSAGGVF